MYIDVGMFTHAGLYVWVCCAQAAWRRACRSIWTTRGGLCALCCFWFVGPERGRCGLHRGVGVVVVYRIALRALRAVRMCS